MKFQFSKMHGAGNDFVVIDGINQTLQLHADDFRALAHRHFGVGADQILLVEASHLPDVDFKYRIFNADGGEVEQCGNGSRAFVRFVIEKKLTTKKHLRIETLGGIIEPCMNDDGSIQVNMGAPSFDTHAVHFHAEGLTSASNPHCAAAPIWHLPLDDRHADSLAIVCVSMGNPHAVQIVQDVQSHPVLQEGALLEKHPRFLKRVNAGFMQIVDEHHIYLRVFERGVGETLACGTGACAAVVAGIVQGVLQSPVSVQTRGGELCIQWDGAQHIHAPVFLSGPAVTIFDSDIDLEIVKQNMPAFFNTTT